MTRHTSSTLLTLVGLLLLATGCYKEAPVVSELGKPRYEIKDGSDYVTHTIYDIYKRTGVKVVYDFDPSNVRWNLGAQLAFNDPRYTKIDPSVPEDMKVVEDNLRLLADNFLSFYKDDFAQTYFPAYIFLTDSIANGRANKLITNSKRDHIAINMYREGEVIRTKPAINTWDAYRSETVSQLHKTLWEFIFTHRISWPTTFSSFSADAYDQILGLRKNLPGTTDEDTENRDKILMSHGFWDYNRNFVYADEKYKAHKDPSLDIADYIYRMTTMSEAEIQEAMGDYTIMHEKYDALRSFIKDKTGMDLQTIGNAAAKKRQTPGE